MFIWQKNLWEILKSRELKQAYLFYGPNGIGKIEFAYHFANFILCSNKLNSPCGCCQSCRLFIFKTNPDFIEVSKGFNSEIKIEQIRELNDKLIKKHSFGNKVVLIKNADNLNLNSANAFLKNLEEPHLNVIFILITSNLSNVIPTIKSRTVFINMPKPTYKESISFLKNNINENEKYLDNLLTLSKNPLLALRFYKENYMEHYLEVCLSLKNFLKNKQSLQQTVLSCQKVSFDILCNWFLVWLNGILKHQVTKNIKYIEILEVDRLLLFLSEKNFSHSIIEKYDKILRFKYLVEKKTNINQQLCIEVILFSFNQLKREKKYERNS